MESTSVPAVNNIPIFVHDFTKMIDVPYQWQILIVVLVSRLSEQDSQGSLVGFDSLENPGSTLVF